MLPWILLIGGFVAGMISGVITQVYFQRAGIPHSRETMLHRPRTGIVPGWVMLLSITSGLAMVIGTLILMVRLPSIVWVFIIGGALGIVIFAFKGKKADDYFKRGTVHSALGRFLRRKPSFRNQLKIFA